MTTDAPVAEQAAPVTETVQPEFAAFTDPNNTETPKTEAGPKTEEPAKSEESAKEGEGEQPPAEGEEKPAPKPKQSAAERIAEVVAKQRAAERRADAAERALAERDKPKEQAERAASEFGANGEPDPTKYDYGEADPKYIKDLARHEARQEFAQLKEQDRRTSQVQEVDRSWETAQAAARSKYADYDEVVTEGANEGKWPCTPAMAHALKTSGETGPDVAYHLASNPDEARRIAAMPEFSQIREMGKLEARLATTPTPKEQPKGKTATDAPPPPDGAARGAGGKFVVSDDTDDFTSFERKHFPPK